MATAFGVRALGILLANSGVGRMGSGNVRQTSVCRWLPPLASCRKPRQTEVCRTFSEFASSIAGDRFGSQLLHPPLRNNQATPQSAAPADRQWGEFQQKA